ncbi:MAG: hypothetical protein KJI71_00880, partial [Patescibacteria group bacterium]|nr:hypothetical protein [Patescibacteria group bacterium]
MEELKENKNTVEENITGKELYELKREQKQTEKKKLRNSSGLSTNLKKIVTYLTYAAIGIGFIVIIFRLIGGQPKLPPISMQGHIEVSPPSHILNEPMPENIQITFMIN